MLVARQGLLCEEEKGLKGLGRRAGGDDVGVVVVVVEWDVQEASRRRRGGMSTTDKEAVGNGV